MKKKILVFFALLVAIALIQSDKVYSQSNINIFDIMFIDTLDIKGAEMKYVNRKSDDTEFMGLTIIVPDKSIKKIRRKSIINLLNEGYVYMPPQSFHIMLLYSKEKRDRNIGCIDETLMNSYKDLYKYSCRKMDGKVYFSSVEGRYLVALVDINLYRQRRWIKKKWFRNNTYIKVITNDCFYKYAPPTTVRSLKRGQ